MIKWILTVSISPLDGHMAIVDYIIDKKKWYWFNFIWWNIFSKLKNAHIKFTEYAGGDKFINVPISLHERSHASHEKECQMIICEYMLTQISRNYR